MKIFRILVASPFILLGFIPFFVGALLFLIAYRIFSIGKPPVLSGTSLRDLMAKMQEVEK